MKPESKFILKAWIIILAVFAAIAVAWWYVIEYAVPYILPILLAPIAFIGWLGDALINGGKTK